MVVVEVGLAVVDVVVDDVVGAEVVDVVVEGADVVGAAVVVALSASESEQAAATAARTRTSALSWSLRMKRTVPPGVNLYKVVKTSLNIVKEVNVWPTSGP